MMQHGMIIENHINKLKGNIEYLDIIIKDFFTKEDKNKLIKLFEKNLSNNSNNSQNGGKKKTLTKWQKFLKKNKGKGKSMDQLSRMYKKENSKKKKTKTKKKTKSKKKSVKRKK